MRVFDLKSVLGACLLVCLSGCANLGHYAQAIGGQLEIMQRSQPIEAVLNAPETAPQLKQKLATVLEIRDFASKELGLPDNGSYRNYADLQRPYVTWNVYATPEFSTQPVTWCFVIAGCVSYRGYFSKEEAEHAGDDLRRQGHDVLVAGIPAYSTLGHFDDPVLNTFIGYGELELAHLIFHELAHQIAYASDDSVFNESLATAIELEGIRRWMAHRGHKEAAGYEARRQKKTQIVTLVMSYRAKLDSLYSSAADLDTKRQIKGKLIQELLREHETLKFSWGGHSEFDAWFSRDLNNAKIASLSLYTQLVPTFLAFLGKHSDNLPAFYADVKVIASLPKDERTRRLRQLGESSFHASAEDLTAQASF
jgi:predicted aminopeptidase